MKKPVRRAYADLEAGQVHYRVAGDVAAPCLVLLHQSPSGSAMYELLMAELASDFYLLAPDLPGFGLSSPMPGAVSVPGYADAVKQWLSHLDLPRCALFGHHTGAAVAVEVAASDPARVAGLALSGPPLLSAELKQSLPGRAAVFPLQESGEHLASMWQRLRDKDCRAPLALSQRELIAAFDSGDSYPDSYAAVAAYDFAGALPAVQCRTLVFAGSEDVLLPSVAPTLALLARGETAEVHGGGASYVCEREVRQVADLLRRFFRSEERDEP